MKSNLITRFRAIWLKASAKRTGTSKRLVLGRFGNRRVMHFYPDGTTEWHTGVVCICDILHLLDTIKSKEGV